MIIRVEHTRGYTCIDNQALRDKRLSFRARGLLAYMLSFPENARLESTRLAAGGTEGRDAVRKSLCDLEAAGYIHRKREQGRDGAWRTYCVLYEQPKTPGRTEDGFSGAGDWESADSGATEDGKPGVGFPGANPSSLPHDQLLAAAVPENPPEAFDRGDHPELIPLTPPERAANLARLRAFREGH